jgi:hypothetical protein
MSDRTSLDLDADQPFDLDREPLDRPKGLGIDWGGDGSDLSRPVRAHVLQALRPNSEPYPPPVDALRQLGEISEADAASARAALGLTQAHMPDLLRMVRDRSLFTANGDTNEAWSSLHAFNALSELDISAHIAELIPLLDLDDDHFFSALPELFSKVGAPAVEPLHSYLADRSRWGFGHTTASEALEKIAEQHPDLREAIVGIFSDVLRDAEHYHELSVTAAMSGLVEIEEEEALPLIRHAFEIGKIDETVRGSWGDVLAELGIDADDDDPLVAESQRRFEERHEQLMPRKQREELLEALDQFKARTRSSQAASISAPTPRALPKPVPAKSSKPQNKAKNKRKAASASRKANRKRK